MQDNGTAPGGEEGLLAHSVIARSAVDHGHGKQEKEKEEEEEFCLVNEVLVGG